MNSYELAYLISSEVSETKLRDIQEKIISFIEKEGGMLSEIKNPVQQKLAYPIKKQERAYFSFLVFNLSAEKMKNLEKKLKTLPEILRFLILRKKITKIKVPSKSKRFVPKIIPKSKTEITTKKEKKVEFTEIEKKLEEILGE